MFFKVVDGSEAAYLTILQVRYISLAGLLRVKPHSCDNLGCDDNEYLMSGFSLMFFRTVG